jgi:hypothetical protein
MKTGKNNNHGKENLAALNARIEETEQRIMDWQRIVHVRTDVLVKDLRHEMTLPTTLLLAGEVGFIVGELTKRPAKKERPTGAKSDVDERPLKKAMNFMSVAHNLYQALPLVWIMDTFFPEDASKTGFAPKVKKSQHPYV